MEDLRIVPADTAELLYNIEALADDISVSYTHLINGLISSQYFS